MGLSHEERKGLRRLVDQRIRENVDYRRYEAMELSLERDSARSSRDESRKRNHKPASPEATVAKRNRERRRTYRRGKSSVLRQYDPAIAGAMLAEFRKLHPDKTMSEVADMFDWTKVPTYDATDSMQRVAQREYAETLEGMAA
jgi:hypothetical protein